MPAVSAVVLSVGEATTARALASVRRQTVPIAEVVTIAGVRPFHRALNDGARRVGTPFFVQVDADMILDDDCVERLLTAAAPDVAVVVGHLRDPLYTRVEGVKLFRTACFSEGGLPDSVSPDTDFVAGLERRGWHTVWALRFDRPPDLWHTFGEHQPEYAPLYTYGKFCVEGRRWRYRANGPALRHHLARLHASPHPMALLAEIALAQGLFLDGERDTPDPYREDAGYTRVGRFLEPTAAPAASARPGTAGGPSLTSWLSARAAFRQAYALGIALGRAGDRDRFAATLRRLHGTRHPFDWLMQVGLCRGLFVDGYDHDACERDWARLSPFRSYWEPRGLARRLGARVRNRLQRAQERTLRRHGRSGP